MFTSLDYTRTFRNPKRSNNLDITYIVEHVLPKVVSKAISVQILLTATDEGDPPLTSTATLTVSVVDVNDNAPQLLKQYSPVLTEHSAARVVVELFARDEDDHSAGHGAPFHFSLDPSATGLHKLFRVENNPSKLNPTTFLLL